MHRKAVIILLVEWCAAVAVLAQSTTGSILGAIKDSSGAVVSDE